MTIKEAKEAAKQLRENKSQININAALKAIDSLIAEVDRVEALQYRQAPCHHVCEANAFQIEIRNLKAQIEDHRQQLRKEQLYVQELADDATLLNYLLTVGENQALNIHDVYSDWDGDGDFKEFCMAAMKEDV